MLFCGFLFASPFVEEGVTNELLDRITESQLKDLGIK